MAHKELTAFGWSSAWTIPDSGELSDAPRVAAEHAQNQAQLLRDMAPRERTRWARHELRALPAETRTELFIAIARQAQHDETLAGDVIVGLRRKSAQEFVGHVSEFAPHRLEQTTRRWVAHLAVVRAKLAAARAHRRELAAQKAAQSTVQRTTNDDKPRPAAQSVLPEDGTPWSIEDASAISRADIQVPNVEPVAIQAPRDESGRLKEAARPLIEAFYDVHGEQRINLVSREHLCNLIAMELGLQPSLPIEPHSERELRDLMEQVNLFPSLDTARYEQVVRIADNILGKGPLPTVRVLPVVMARTAKDPLGLINLFEAVEPNGNSRFVDRQGNVHEKIDAQGRTVADFDGFLSDPHLPPNARLIVPRGLWPHHLRSGAPLDLVIKTPTDWVGQHDSVQTFFAGTALLGTGGMVVGAGLDAAGTTVTTVGAALMLTPFATAGAAMIGAGVPTAAVGKGLEVAGGTLASLSAPYLLSSGTHHLHWQSEHDEEAWQKADTYWEASGIAVGVLGIGAAWLKAGSKLSTLLTLPISGLAAGVGYDTYDTWDQTPPEQRTYRLLSALFNGGAAVLGHVKNKAAVRESNQLKMGQIRDELYKELRSAELTPPLASEEIYEPISADELLPLEPGDVPLRHVSLPLDEVNGGVAYNPFSEPVHHIDDSLHPPPDPSRAEWYQPNQVPNHVLADIGRLLRSKGRSDAALASEARDRHVIVVRDAQGRITRAGLLDDERQAQRAGWRVNRVDVLRGRYKDGAKGHGADRFLTMMVSSNDDMKPLITAVQEGAKHFTDAKTILWTSTSDREGADFLSMKGVKRRYSKVTAQAPAKLAERIERGQTAGLPARVLAARTDTDGTVLPEREQQKRLADNKTLPEGWRESGYSLTVERPRNRLARLVSFAEPGSPAYWINTKWSIAKAIYRQFDPVKKIERVPLNHDVSQRVQREVITLPRGTLSADDAQMLAISAERQERAEQARTPDEIEQRVKQIQADFASPKAYVYFVAETPLSPDGTPMADRSRFTSAGILRKWYGKNNDGRFAGAEIPDGSAAVLHAHALQGDPASLLFAHDAADVVGMQIKARELNIVHSQRVVHDALAAKHTPIVRAEFNLQRASPKLLALPKPARLSLSPQLQEALAETDRLPVGEREDHLRAILTDMNTRDFLVPLLKANELRPRLLGHPNNGHNGWAPNAAIKLMEADPAAVDRLRIDIRDEVVRFKLAGEADRTQRDRRLLQSALEQLPPPTAMPEIPDGIVQFFYRRVLAEPSPGPVTRAVSAGAHAVIGSPAVKPIRNTVGELTGRPIDIRVVETFNDDRVGGPQRVATLERARDLTPRERREFAQALRASNRAQHNPLATAPDLEQKLAKSDWYVVRVRAIDPAGDLGPVLEGAVIERNPNGPANDGFSNIVGGRIDASLGTVAETKWMFHTAASPSGGRDLLHATEVAAKNNLLIDTVISDTRRKQAFAMHFEHGHQPETVRFTEPCESILLGMGPNELLTTSVPLRNEIAHLRATLPQPADRRLALRDWLVQNYPSAQDKIDLAMSLPDNTIEMGFKRDLEPVRTVNQTHVEQFGRWVKDGAAPTLRHGVQTARQLNQDLNPLGDPKAIESTGWRLSAQNGWYRTWDSGMLGLKRGLQLTAVAATWNLAHGRFHVKEDDDRIQAKWNGAKDPYFLYALNVPVNPFHTEFPRVTLATWGARSALRGFDIAGMPGSDQPALWLGRYGTSAANPDSPGKSFTHVLPMRFNFGELDWGIEYGDNDCALRAQGNFRTPTLALNIRSDLPTGPGAARLFSFTTMITTFQPSFLWGLYCGEYGIAYRVMGQEMAFAAQHFAAPHKVADSAITASVSRKWFAPAQYLINRGWLFFPNSAYGKPEPDWEQNDLAQDSRLRLWLASQWEEDGEQRMTASTPPPLIDTSRDR